MNRKQFAALHAAASAVTAEIDARRYLEALVLRGGVADTTLGQQLVDLTNAIRKVTVRAAYEVTKDHFGVCHVCGAMVAGREQKLCSSGECAIAFAEKSAARR